jgi:hypothetical protein
MIVKTTLSILGSIARRATNCIMKNHQQLVYFQISLFNLGLPSKYHFVQLKYAYMLYFGAHYCAQYGHF